VEVDVHVEVIEVITVGLLVHVRISIMFQIMYKLNSSLGAICREKIMRLLEVTCKQVVTQCFVFPSPGYM